MALPLRANCLVNGDSSERGGDTRSASQLRPVRNEVGEQFARVLLIGVLASAIGASVACASTPTGSDAGPATHQYVAECANWTGPVHCSPKVPVTVPNIEKTCKELGIDEGTPCRAGDASCLDSPAVVEGAPGAPPCQLVPEHLLCRERRSFKGCPSSTAKVKKHIEYLTPAEVSEAAREIRDLPLVRYRYKSQGDGVTPTVGIIIEDVPGASFVDHESQRVNLYSFVSATAAAYQAQAKELDDLKARLAAVEAKCGPRGPFPTTQPTRASRPPPRRPGEGAAGDASQ